MLLLHLPSTLALCLLSMASSWVITALLLSLAFACFEPSTCHELKGSVSCLDCSHHGHLSGIRVLVRCDKVKKLAMATTDNNGSFKAELPTDSSTSSTNCLAKLLGGPKQLCSSKKDVVSKVVKAHGSNSYTISTPLTFFITTCPPKTKTPSSQSSSKKDAKSGTLTPAIGSSETVDLPVPPEWGLPPTSYYLPVIPIIGIP